MFPRRQRLPRGEFPTALSTGRRLSSPNFSVVLPKNANGYAVIVSKKAARLSVTRHKVKRRVLSALRALPLPPSLVVYPKSAVFNMPYDEMKKELSSLLSKIRE